MMKTILRTQLLTIISIFFISNISHINAMEHKKREIIFGSKNYPGYDKDVIICWKNLVKFIKAIKSDLTKNGSYPRLNIYITKENHYYNSIILNVFLPENFLTLENQENPEQQVAQVVTDLKVPTINYFNWFFDLLHNSMVNTTLLEREPFPSYVLDTGHENFEHSHRYFKYTKILSLIEEKRNVLPRKFINQLEELMKRYRLLGIARTPLLRVPDFHFNSYKIETQKDSSQWFDIIIATYFEYFDYVVDIWNHSCIIKNNDNFKKYYYDFAMEFDLGQVSKVYSSLFLKKISSHFLQAQILKKARSTKIMGTSETQKLDFAHFFLQHLQ